MTVTIEIIKDIIFFAAVGGGGYLMWILLGKLTRKYSWNLDSFGRFCLSLCAIGTLCWMLFMIYFAATT